MQTGADRFSVHPFTASNIGEHYDQFAWAYRRYWGEHIHHGLFVNGDEDARTAQERMVRYCADRAGVQAGMKVADVGCGHGGTAALLARDYSCAVLGLTISRTQLELARKNCSSLDGRVRFEHADAEAYAFPASSFDLIWNMESSEHFFDKRAYFRKVAAALKPGGRLMLAAWSGSMKNRLVRDVAKIFLCPELWTAAEYAAAIESAGMKIISQEQLAEQVARTWEISAQQVNKARWMLSLLPAAFTEFTQGIELMREGYHNGKLQYSVMVADNTG